MVIRQMHPLLAGLVFFSFLLMMKTCSSHRSDLPPTLFGVATVVNRPNNTALCTSACSQNTTFMNNSLEVEGGKKGYEWSFPDPLPSLVVPVYINVTVWGRFHCNETGDGFVLVMTLDSEVVGYAYPTKAGEFGCECPNCVYPLHANHTSSDKWNHGANQTLRLAGFPGPFYVSEIEVDILYHQPVPECNLVSPNGSPFEQNNTITAYGGPFISGLNYTCTFNNSQQPGQVMDQFRVSCPIPVLPPSSTDFIQVEVGLSIGPFTSDSTQPFWYYNQPTLSSIDPVNGPTKNGPNVTLHGSGFFDKPRLWCRFGQNNIPVRAVFLSASSVLCITPSSIRPDGGEVGVGFSMNGVDYVYAPQNYTFLSPPTPTPTPTPSNPHKIPLYFWLVLGGIAVFLVVSLLAVFLLVRFKVNTIRNEKSEIFYDETSPFYEDGDNYSVQDKNLPNQIPFEEFKQLKLIEKGSFGVIYKGVWNGTVIALKKLPSSGMTNRLRAEFQQEALMMQNLRHPNVLQYLGTSVYGRELCIVMEYLQRGSLYRVLHKKNSEWSLNKVKKIAIDSARGVNYLHKQEPPIIHRDLKSHNLLLDEHWRVKVCDFGLSRMVEEANATMTACGTPSWTAPEVLRNEKYTTKADVYSFGVVLWEMFSRQDPFPGMPPFQIVFAVGTQGLRPRLRPDWPEDWVQLMTDCWAEDPSDRPCFDEVLDRLEVLEELGTPSPVRSESDSPMVTDSSLKTLPISTPQHSDYADSDDESRASNPGNRV